MTQTTTDRPAATPGASAYWRSLQELQGEESFQEFLHREFPQAASEFPEGVSRRRWMQLMSASFALAGAAGCRWETEKIAPFVDRPEGYVPGAQEHFATNIMWGGGPKHLLVTKYDGRPIKVDGNPEHPASGGATDAQTQAATLALYDPDRSMGVVMREGGESFAKEWSDFEAYLATRLEELADGAKMAILTTPLQSYTLFDAMERVAQKFPAAKFYEYEPLSREAELEGTRLAFGKRLRTHLRLEDAMVIASFDADPLAQGADSLRAARGFTENRDPDKPMNRLYAVESQYSTTGAAADHRLPVMTSRIGAMLGQLRDAIKELKANDDHEHGEKIEGEPTPEQFLEVMADDLVHNQGESLVVVGPNQPAEVHAIALEINGLLGNLGKTVYFTDEPQPTVPRGTIAELTGAVRSGMVDTVIVLDGNPAYDAPADVPFAAALEEAKHAIRLSTYDDETSRLCRWSLPETHPLEQWGDVIGWDGSVGVTQPMIDPLANGRTKLALLSMLAGDAMIDEQQATYESVSDRADALDESAWTKLLHWGLLRDESGEAVPPLGFSPVAVSLQGSDFPAPEAPADDALELVFTASSSVYDGRLANSGWMQETPDFLTKLTWDNALLVAPATADQLRLEQGKLAKVMVGEAEIEAPVYIMPGQAAGSLGLALGYGRTAAGRVGGLVYEDGKVADGMYVEDLKGFWFPSSADPVGVDAYPLRTSETQGFTLDVKVRNLRQDYLLASTQDHHAIDQGGLEAIGYRTGQLIRQRAQSFYNDPEHPDNKEFAPHMSHEVMAHEEGESRPTKPLWNLPQYPAEGQESVSKWGMSIDLTKCIGCNACAVACQAENNVPVVGKDQVARGREMHWIRIDRYFKGVADPENAADPANFVNPQVAHQPVACQQCETAPCEQVCPVAATMHSDEGLNDMVYNRCIGTRYCANNCPYKVRRFNYFRYTKRLYEANNELMTLVMNPEVTIRSRGVMEKCTYCTQRISAARIESKNRGEPIRDGDIHTACQQVCPTKAIEFGDLNDADSRVAQAHASPRAYGILTELMTIPRTKYLARITNPHPRLVQPMDEAPVHHGGHDGHGGHAHDDDHAHDDHSAGHDAAHEGADHHGEEHTHEEEATPTS